jgi:hypothetical protein
MTNSTTGHHLDKASVTGVSDFKPLAMSMTDATEAVGADARRLRGRDDRCSNSFGSPFAGPPKKRVGPESITRRNCGDAEAWTGHREAPPSVDFLTSYFVGF